MKLFLTISFILIKSSYLEAQIYQLFYFVDNKPFVYDTTLQIKANNASAYYYKDKIDSSIIDYTILFTLKPNYRIAYNLSVLYGIKNEPDSTLKYLSIYLNEDEKCECAYLENPIFRFLDVNINFLSLKDKCKVIQEKKGIKDIFLYNKLAFLDGKEQEVLGASMYRDIYEERKKITLDFFSIVDTLNIPNSEQILKSGINHFQTLLLHSDLFPRNQIAIARIILNSKNVTDYNKKQLAYTIDRGLCNLNLPQIYGTILAKNPKTKEDCLYQFDNYEKLLKMRKEFDFQIIEDYLINKSILK